MKAFENLAVQSLLALSGLLGVSNMPSQMDPNWNLIHPWTEAPNGLQLEARSTEISKLCSENTKAFVEFPPVIHGAHEIFADGVRVELFGAPLSNQQQPYIQEMKIVRQLSGDPNSYVYRATAPANRSINDYTVRVIPHFPEVAVPLEEDHILWQK